METFEPPDSTGGVEINKMRVRATFLYNMN